MNIFQNIKDVRREVAEISHGCGRGTEEVKIIAVSKYKPLSAIIAAIEAERGNAVSFVDSPQLDFGENHAQEFRDKTVEFYSGAVALSDEVKAATKWHFIGSLQSNKIKYIADKCFLLHSLDRLSLAQKLNEAMNNRQKVIDCLIQINSSGESSKSGLNPNEVHVFCQQVSKMQGIKIKGFMTIAENSDSKKIIRQNFRDTREIYNEVKDKCKFDNFELSELSYGMSSDYDIAIEEGATYIRVGSKIFGER